MLKGNGVTLVAVAAINRTGTRPFEDGQYKDIKVVELEGQKYIRVPIIKQAKVRYGSRILIFDQKAFDQMIDNWEKNVTDSPPYLRASHETGDVREPAICWFDRQMGGFLRQEGKWLYGYGKPVSEEAQTLVETGGFRFASADIDLDYVSKEIAALEGRPQSSQLVVFEAANFLEGTEDNMPKGNEENGTVQLSAEEHQVLLDAQSQLVEANKRIAQLEAQIKPPEPDVPESVKAMIKAQEDKIAQLEARSAERERVLKLEARKAKVQGIVTKLHATGADGQGHPAVFANWVKSILLQENVVENDKEIVTLERGEGDTITLEAFESYVFEMVSRLVEIMPKIVQVDGRTIANDTQLERANKDVFVNGLPMAMMNKLWDEAIVSEFGPPKKNEESGREN